MIACLFLFISLSLMHLSCKEIRNASAKSFQIQHLRLDWFWVATSLKIHGIHVYQYVRSCLVFCDMFLQSQRESTLACSVLLAARVCVKIWIPPIARQKLDTFYRHNRETPQVSPAFSHQSFLFLQHWLDLVDMWHTKDQGNPTPPLPKPGHLTG